MRLKHSHTSANLDTYTEPGNDDVAVSVLRYDVEFSRGSDGTLETVPRARPRYSITVKHRTSRAWVDTLEFTYEPKRKPKSPVLSGAKVASLVEEAQRQVSSEHEGEG